MPAGEFGAYKDQKQVSLIILLKKYVILIYKHTHPCQLTHTNAQALTNIHLKKNEEIRVKEKNTFILNMEGLSIKPWIFQEKKNRHP